MITGDNQLTAAYIGKELKFGPNEKSLFASGGSNGNLTWMDIDDKVITKTSTPAEIENLSK